MKELKLLIIFAMFLIVPTMVFAGSWSGTVVDENTLVGVEYVNVDAILGSTIINSSQTDNAGQFTVAGLPDGSYTLNFTVSEYIPKTIFLAPAINNSDPAKTDLTWPLPIKMSQSQPGSISGTVDNGTNTLQGATIRALQGGAEIAANTTDSNGDYIINLIDGTYVVEASLTEYETQNITNVVVQPGLTTDVDFTLQATCTENWDCTGWSSCSGGTQTRICTDLNACGTTVNKPAESQSCSTGGSSCFPAGTKILMADGTDKNIEDIKVGDKILGFDGNNQVPVEVLELESPVRDHMYTLTFEDDSKLELTREHPLYTEDGWKSLSPEETAMENDELEVKELRLGDRVLNKEGDYVKITGIDYAEKQVQTYNLKRVSECNNFFANSYLAHNKGSSYSGTDYEIDIDKGETITKELRRRDSVKFDYEEEEHEVYVSYVYASSASVTVSSDPVTATIALFQTRGFNFDDDLMNDFFITLKSISSGVAEFEFKLAESLDLPSSPTAPAAPSQDQVVDVPQQSGSPIRIIVEDEDVIIEEDEDEESSVFASTGNFFKNMLDKILYLKYIVAGVVILAVLILIISLVTRLNAVKKTAKRSRKKEELLKRVKELESQLKDLKKAV